MAATGAGRGAGRCSVPDAHRERVEVLVQLVQERDGLDDHVVRPVHVELDLAPRRAGPRQPEWCEDRVSGRPSSAG